jgi:hypothetical protein
MYNLTPSKQKQEISPLFSNSQTVIVETTAAYTASMKLFVTKPREDAP